MSHAQGNIHDVSVSCGIDILQIDGKAREAPGLAHARARFKASGPSARGAFEILETHLRLSWDANGVLKDRTRLEREFACYARPLPLAANGQRALASAGTRRGFPEIAAFFRSMSYGAQPGGPATRYHRARRWATY